MTRSSPNSRTQELLHQRERNGVRTFIAMRVFFAVVLVATVWVTGVNMFERIATTLLGLVLILAIGACFALLQRGASVTRVGMAGCGLDIVLLGTLPIFWYLSVGGNDIPAVYMLNTQVTEITLAVLVLNALAFRPLYPIVVAAGAIVVHLLLLAYVLQDPRTVVSSDFVDATIGDSLNLELFLTQVLIIALTGATLGFLTHLVRKTVERGVGLEVANTQLGRYFSPGVVAQISRDADHLLGVGGRTQDVAVLFCDIRDFTTITEKMAPSEVVNFLSEYHSRMVRAIFEHGGTIDKFIGDAIMVTFGTPEPASDDAHRAVLAGMAMNRALAELNEERIAAGKVAIRHGIGIHFGSVTAGNIGTDDRLEYTVIGDTVNVASRIQDACKTVGEAFLISDAVAQRLPLDMKPRALTKQQVKGRKEPVQLYSLID